ncbi:unnamed protein product [Echinostoma caproni]|uniref:WD_REPEATS_REGION domain-containing protein n=1 Tax=Echinostoma caproni TaxID=27848 RepID=A0A183B7J9_9TREM|nr:unnamed protein product [Echinostoma caproni]
MRSASIKLLRLTENCGVVDQPINTSAILWFFLNLATSDLEIQNGWISRTRHGPLADRLSAMRQFVATNSSILTKYPVLFTQLAANYEASPWIRQLGLSQLQSEIDSSDVNRFHFLVRRQAETDARALMPHTIHQPTEVATVVALSPDSHVLVYGTIAGAISVVDASTLREIRSFYGHGGAVLSLCFLEDYRTATAATYRKSQSEYSLASTAQDQTVCLWLIQGLGNTEESVGRRLISWTGPQRRAITCSAWHPDLGLLATGSLDCTVVLWKPPRTLRELSPKQTESGTSGSSRPSDYRILSTQNSPVSSLVFRLPNDAASQPQTDLAVGCWDGKVRIFDLTELRLKTVSFQQLMLNHIYSKRN